MTKILDHMRLICYNIIAKTKKGGKNMARITLNISDKLNNEMREYIRENDFTITTFVQLAISNYLQELKRYEREWMKFLDDLIRKANDIN